MPKKISSEVLTAAPLDPMKEAAKQFENSGWGASADSDVQT